ncbi:MAG: cyclic nucleotide-binding domain-containing protein, partial [Bacteroidota bacterium]
MENLQYTVALLQRIPYFSQMNLEALEEVVREAEMVTLKCGEKLLQQGEKGDFAFILLEGRLRAMDTPPDAPASRIGEISRGEIVGEM